MVYCKVYIRVNPSQWASQSLYILVFLALYCIEQLEQYVTGTRSIQFIYTVLLNSGTKNDNYVQAFTTAMVLCCSAGSMTRTCIKPDSLIVLELINCGIPR